MTDSYMVQAPWREFLCSWTYDQQQNNILTEDASSHVLSNVVLHLNTCQELMIKRAFASTSLEQVVFWLVTLQLELKKITNVSPNSLRRIATHSNCLCPRFVDDTSSPKSAQKA